MPSPLRQPNFLGGELDPDFHGRTDLDRYYTSLRRSRNFLVTPKGHLLNRSGTKLVKEVKTSAKLTILIPFLFGGDQNYVLEFGDLYFRVHYQGAYLSVEVVTTYVEADLRQLRYAQSGDILTITHPSYAVREVKRTAHTTWSIADKAFSSGQSAPTTPTSTLDTTTAPQKPWRVDVTAVSPAGEESLPLAVVTSGNFCAEAGTTNLYGWTAPGGTAPAHYNVYRGQSGIKGLVGQAVGTSFRDDGQEPEYGIRARADTAPFNAADKRPSVVTYHEQRLVLAATNNEPNAIWMSKSGDFRNFDRVEPPNDDDAVLVKLASRQYEEIRGLVPSKDLLALTSQVERRVFAPVEGPISATNIDSKPHTYRGAAKVQPIALGDIGLFVQQNGSQLHDLFYDYEVRGYRGNELSLYARHLLDGHSIVDMAYSRNPFGTVWAVREDGILLGLTYDRETQTFAWHWHDTFRLYADAAISHKFEAVCVVPEGTEDATYVVVKRGSKRFVERFATRRVYDARAGVFLDCALSYDGRVTDGTTVTFTDGSTWAAGEPGIIVTASAAKFAAGDATNQDWVVLQPNLPFGVPATSSNQVRLRITTFNSTTQVEGTLLDDVPVSMRNVPLSDWSIARDHLAGLDHLNGFTVGALADGNVDHGNLAGDLHVDGGAIVLANKATIVHVGLRYVSELEFLDVVAAKLEVRGLLKNIAHVGIEVSGSFPTEYKVYVGETVAEAGVNRWQPPGQVDAVTGDPQTTAGAYQYLGEIRLRWDVDEAQLNPVTGFPTVTDGWDNAVVPVLSDWNKYGRAWLGTESCLPLAVRGIWREVELGG